MYPKRHGDEYYDTNTYKVDSKGKQVYALLKNKSETYLQIEGLDIMAKQLNSKREWVPYFAMDQFNHPICPRLETNMLYLELDISYPKNSENKELYPKLNDKEYYIGKNKACQYAKEENQEQYYAQNKEEEYYAFQINESGDFIEFPRINKNNEAIYIQEKDSFSYLFNLSKFLPLYPKNNLNEYYVKVYGKECFAIRNNRPFYAKTGQGHDIIPRESNNLPYYIFYTDNGKKYEVYPKKNNEEYYLEYTSCKRYAKKDKDQYYAKKENQDDFLADEYTYQYYALDKDNVEIYPSKSNKNNFYKKINNKEIVAKNKNLMKGFYAKDLDKNEFYPKSFEEEMIKIEIIPEVRENYEFIEATLLDIITHEASTT